MGITPRRSEEVTWGILKTINSGHIMSEFEFKFRSDEAEDMPEFGALPDGKHLCEN